MKKTNTYTINHDNATITITKAYSKNANKPGTKEFKELTTLHKSYPDYKIVHRTAVVDKTTKQTHSGLSYGNMEKYIQKKNENKPDKGAVERKAFEDAKEYYKTFPGAYGKVKAWFLEQYPDYENIDFSIAEEDQSNKPTPTICSYQTLFLE